MQLGNHLLLVIHTKDKEKSLAFYKKMGFRIVKKNADNIILSSGTTLFLLHFGQLDADVKIVFYCPKIALTAARLRVKKIKTFLAKNKEKNTSEITVQMSEGFKILLSDDLEYNVSLDSSFKQNKNGVIGHFVEYALQTKDIKTDILAWQSIGFKRVLYSECLSTSAILKHEQLQIGLYQNYQSEVKAAFTYRSNNMKLSIDNIEKRGILWSEKVLPNQTESFNGAKLVSPENQDFWLFKSSVYGMKFVSMPPSKAHS